jgi:hypothetical protein
VLGARFELLPEPLRSFHDSASGGRAEGVFRVERGPGLARRIIAFFAGFPPASEAVQVRLEVEVDGAMERWTRDFDGHRMVSDQWQQGGLLVERFFPLRCSLALDADREGLSFQVERSYLGPLPLPRAFNPRLITEAKVRDGGWHLLLRIEAPLFGLLVEYEGDLRCL